MNTLATVAALRRHLGIQAQGDDGRLLGALIASSRMIQGQTARRFTPYRLTRFYDSVTHKPTHELHLHDDALSIESVLLDNSPLSMGDVRLIGGQLLLRLDGGTFQTESGTLGSIAVSGIWGFHENWAQAWRDSGDSVQNANLSTTDTLITVTNSSAYDRLPAAQNGLMRFQVGQLWQVGTEWMRVITLDHTLNQITVLRGVNGSVAQAHPPQTPIAIYQPCGDVQWACLRYAEWLLTEAHEPMPVGVNGVLRALSRIRVS